MATTATRSCRGGRGSRSLMERGGARTEPCASTAQRQPVTPSTPCSGVLETEPPRAVPGAAGVYGNAIMIGTVQITQAQDHIEVTCNSTSGSQGTYTGPAQIIAQKIPGVVLS